MVTDRDRCAVPKQPCPFCCGHAKDVWYWGWYERKEGRIPCEGCGASGPIPLRRFYCPTCKRTFSWRPPFLVFRRWYTAAVYQLLFKCWVRGHGLGRYVDDGAWFMPRRSACRAFCEALTCNASGLIDRLLDEVRCLHVELPPSPPRGPCWEPGTPERELWQMSLEVSWRYTRTQQQPRFPCHYLCIALAFHPDGTRYSLGSA